MKSQGIFHSTLREAPFQDPYLSVDDLLARGVSALQDGLLDDAERWLEEARQKAPFDARVHSTLSTVYRRRNKTEQALGSLVRALELDPNDRDVILNCSTVFTELGKCDDAREILQAYVDRTPWDYQAKDELARIVSMSSTSSSRTGNSVNEETLDMAGLFNQQGERELEQAKLDHAKACFEIALEHNPDFAQAHCNLGTLCWQQGNLEKALDHLQQAITLAPDDPDVLYNSSKALAAAGEVETAAEFLKIYLQGNPNDNEAWNDYTSLMQAMANSGWNPDGLDGEVSQIYLKMGQALAEAKDIMGAAEAYQRAIRLEEKHGEPYYRLGELHLALGQEDDALEILRLGLEVDPAHKACVLSAGSILASRGELIEARAHYETCLDHQPDDEVQAALDKVPAPSND